MKSLSVILVLSILFVSIPAIHAQTAAPDFAVTPSVPMKFGLTDGTPVKLRLGRTMSSADAKTGETVDFEVLEDVKVGDIVVIARSSTALATVAQAHPNGRMGKGGKLDIVLDSVHLVSGEKISLRASKETKGGSTTGAMTGAIVASAILFFPAAPFFLFMKGKNITIPKGTEITAYTNGEIPLDLARFKIDTAPPSAAETKRSNANDASSIMVKSNPEGADIEVDGQFMGNAPSTLQLKPGEHKITVKKSGYTAWERTIVLNGSGNITIDASLEKLP
jgi:hypothetical protein